MPSISFDLIDLILSYISGIGSAIVFSFCIKKLSFKTNEGTENTQKVSGDVITNVSGNSSSGVPAADHSVPFDDTKTGQKSNTGNNYVSGGVVAAYNQTTNGDYASPTMNIGVREK